MLEKCTEADVYRKAFPQDFSGIYLDDAMPQDTPPADGAPDARPRGRVTAGEIVDSRPRRMNPRSAPDADANAGSGPAADAGPAPRPRRTSPPAGSCP